ncbi:polysaccharide deacetylase family protein [uncultured Methanolobus sp.]|uniref:polysaccharide deacetylase family protein n=1 Tax=uncultured Methanolobus sp. TaxID=218300 RepID=UPI00374886C5
MLENNTLEKLKEKKELWDIFTKKEEYEPSFLDKYGRFPHYLSNHRDVFFPIISEYLIENGFRPKYPDGKKFAVCLTHDIDVVHQGYLGCAFYSIKSAIKGNFMEAIKYPIYAINKQHHPYRNFREIMDLEEKYGATSSFYFLALEPGEKDYTYNIQSLKDELKYIDSRGWDIGLHGGHESYNNYEDLIKKKEKLEKTLGKKVVGYRNHFLRFKTPETWELLSKAGFKYDTTFGYSDCVGFRNGMCHPFKPFNLKTNNEIDILEIPMTIMDCTLLRDYMKLDIKDSWKLTKNLIDTVEKYNGVITILWHNTYMQAENLAFYEKILMYCHDKNAWMTSGKEIYECCSK